MTHNLIVKTTQSCTFNPFTLSVLSCHNSLVLIVLGFNDTSTLWVILCCLPEKGRKETEEIVEEMKESNREERGTGMKVKKQKK